MDIQENDLRWFIFFLSTAQQTGLIVACYQGYVDVVIALSQCPYVDVNWQDKEGNTALMTAAQAGKGNEGIKLQQQLPVDPPGPSFGCSMRQEPIYYPLSCLGLKSWWNRSSNKSSLRYLGIYPSERYCWKGQILGWGLGSERKHIWMQACSHL